MRIGYLLHAQGSQVPGVRNKIVAQARQWVAYGHEVRLFVLTRDQPDVWTSRFEHATVAPYTHMGSRMRAILRLVRAMRAYDPDVIYFRYDLFYPPMAWLPRRAARVVEVNTDDTTEFALGTRRRYYYNALTRNFVYGRARALVFVAEELSQRPAFRGFRARKEVITNGVVIGEYPELPAPNGAPPTLVFVGNPSRVPWQGIDKVVRLATLRPEWRFEVVGESLDGETVPSNMSWHGLLERDALIQVLARADVGIGTLALHRKGLEEASALKVREYLAVGLPVIVGCRDPDLQGLEPYALTLPNTERNIENGLSAIDAFVSRSIGLRVPRSAVTQLDVSRKELQRLRLFESVVG
jgi:glycosyltransferase involved in cell wall biosynthesis